jgi:hypothetical protein
MIAHTVRTPLPTQSDLIVHVEPRYRLIELIAMMFVQHHINRLLWCSASSWLPVACFGKQGAQQQTLTLSKQNFGTLGVVEDLRNI